MDQWTPHSAINELLQDLLGRVQKIVGSEFVGMYLYGSLASGDFQPNRSDIDVVVVTGEARAAIARLVQVVALDHRAHCAVQQQDALFEQGSELGGAVGLHGGGVSIQPGCECGVDSSIGLRRFPRAAALSVGNAPKSLCLWSSALIARR